MSRLKSIFYMCIVFIYGSLRCQEHLPVSVDKIRLTWNDDPTGSVTIGWDQLYGKDPIVYYDTVDHGENWQQYSMSQQQAREVRYLGMDTRFARLAGLVSDAVYYFVIKDSDDVSERFWFRTAPDEPAPFTCILGGDTKAMGEALKAGQFTNRMVAKLRPLFVVFCGDFTNKVKSKYWKQWLTDWFELTRTADGRLFPVVPVMGNHENDQTVLNKIFDTPYQGGEMENTFYSLSFGGGFFHLIVLNSMIDPGGEQRQWLAADLKAYRDFVFKLAAYHKPFFPHTKRKKENLEQYRQWAYLFDAYGLDISLDADSHLSKITYPLRPDSLAGVEGFVRDDVNGTMYLGEGSWGASPRKSDDTKSWTLRSGSFNQFKWLQVFPETGSEQAHIDIRTVITSTRDMVNQAVSHVKDVSPLTENDVFAIPDGMKLFSTGPYGDVITYPLNVGLHE